MNGSRLPKRLVDSIALGHRVSPWGKPTEGGQLRLHVHALDALQDQPRWVGVESVNVRLSFRCSVAVAARKVRGHAPYMRGKA